MPHFGGLLVVVAVAFAAPFVLGLFPSVRLPSVVLEIVAGIAIGPSALGWVKVDESIEVLSVLGLVFLLFLAGLEIDFQRLRGRVLRLASLGFALSLVVAIAAALVLRALDLIQSPVLIAIVLSSTSLGVIIPVLKDAGEVGSRFGQLVIGAGSIADFGAIILLSVFFSGKGGTGATLLLIGCLLGLAGAVYLGVRGAEHLAVVNATLQRLQDTTAQIRVRGAVVLLVAFAALAESFGLEVILGAFAAGAVLTLVDRDEVMTHPFFRRKLEAMGFGLFIPVFFVTSGIRFDTSALFGSASTIAMVPIFLAALVLARGLPALLYRAEVGARKTLVAALLQATSLPFIVAATAIGRDLGLIDAAGSSAFIAAGLLSVLVFPLAGLTLLRGAGRGMPRPAASDDAPLPAM